MKFLHLISKFRFRVLKWEKIITEVLHLEMNLFIRREYLFSHTNLNIEYRIEPMSSSQNSLFRFPTKLEKFCGTIFIQFILYEKYVRHIFYFILLLLKHIFWKWLFIYICLYIELFLQSIFINLSIIACINIFIIFKYFYVSFLLPQKSYNLVLHT